MCAHSAKRKRTVQIAVHTLPEVLVRRGLSALIVVDALAGIAALLAILIYFLAEREEEAEFVLLVILLVVCCANAVVVAIFRRETGDHLEAQEEIRKELATIRGMLEKEARTADAPGPGAPFDVR